MSKSSIVLRQGLLAACAALLAAHAGAQAGGSMPGDSSAEQQQFITQARERLKLTPEQQPKVQDLIRSEAAKLKAIDARYGGNASREARINRAREMQAAREQFRGSLSQVLSPEQMKEWDALRDEAQKSAGARRAAQ